MKQKILAIVIFIIVIVGVITNSIVLQKMTDSFIAEVNALPIDNDDALSKVKKLNEEFKSSVHFIGLTVSHDDLTNIEDCLAELNGCLSVGDTEGAVVVKYRLISFLEHLRRLVGFNIDTII